MLTSQGPTLKILSTRTHVLYSDLAVLVEVALAIR